MSERASVLAMRAIHLSVQFNQAEVKLWFPLFLLHHCERLCHPLFKILIC